MSLQLVSAPCYEGGEGVAHVRQLQHALNEAVAQENWRLVRQLDSMCLILIDKVIAANKDDSRSLAMALSELKGVYANLIIQCKTEMLAVPC